MDFSVISAFIYGILAIAGGIIGYVQAQSKVSLISGTISGLLIIAAAALYLQGQTWGLTAATALTGLLVIVFAVRLFKTRKFMPAGLMVILGLATLAAMVFHFNF